MMKKPKNPLPYNMHAAGRQLLAEAVDIHPSQPETSCWEIPPDVRGRATGGYTVAWHRGRQALAHRIVSEYTYGPFRADKPCSLHKCDNPGCIRPSHLWRGTRADNAHDRDAKGRQRSAKGEQNGNCKLPDSGVLEVFRRRADGHSQAAIADIVGVSQPHVSFILAGKFRSDIYQQYHGTVPA